MEVMIGLISFLVVFYLNRSLGKMRIEQALFYEGAEEIQVRFITLTRGGYYIYEVVYVLEGIRVHKKVKYGMLGQLRGL